MTRPWTPETADHALSALARTPRLLVALDFDGTASPHVDDPMSARALPEVAEAVARLAALPDTTVAYVSGRSLHHLREIAEHADDSLLALAGSHGVQYWFPGEDGGDDDDDAALAEPDGRRETEAEVQELIRPIPGIDFEPKSLGFGVHARRATQEDEDRAFTLVDEWAAQRIPRWRRRTGHHIREFSWRSEGKDAAIARLREHYDATAVLFAGDDVTDEDAMRTLGPDDVGVRVGPGETAAVLRVEDPQGMGLLLGVLAHERASAQE
ncbi:trehalose-phosphatase [Microbacterium resistens]|uniref:trehalose-phosphatase n=1 Tax=Microbacterium resistens TaxID=156977 RepID=UPI00366FC39E